jgi:hypothetical protein
LLSIKNGTKEKCIVKTAGDFILYLPLKANWLERQGANRCLWHFVTTLIGLAESPAVSVPTKYYAFAIMNSGMETMRFYQGTQVVDNNFYWSL